MIVTLFRTRLRPELVGTPEQDAYRAMNGRMAALAQTIPGFVAVGALKEPDGTPFTVVIFESEESLRTWREHPEHLEAQRLGQETWYQSYSAEILAPVRAYSFTREGGRVEE